MKTLFYIYFWAPHFSISIMTWIFFSLILSLLLLHLRQIFKGKKFCFCFVGWFCFLCDKNFFFPWKESTKKIHWTRRSALVILFFSYLIKPLSFISSSWQQQKQQYTQNFSFSLIFWVCVLSYLRFYLNGVDIQLEHSLTHCTFKARVLRQFLCAFQAFSSRSLHFLSIFFFFFHIAFRASNSQHDYDQGETELMKKCIKHIKRK